MLSGQACNHWGFSPRDAKICMIPAPHPNSISGQWMKVEPGGLPYIGIQICRKKAAIIQELNAC